MKKKKIKLCLTKQLLNMFKLWCEWGIRLVKKLTGEFMRVNELYFLIEYKILKGFVCWRHERAQ